MVQTLDPIFKIEEAAVMNELNILVDEWAGIQAGVDQAIYKRFEIKEPKELLGGLLLALKVEAGELANETRCFKHWSSKGPAEPPVILEEFADNMAFTLSIGLISGFLLEVDTGRRLYYPPIPIYLEGQELDAKRDLTKQFNLFYQKIATFEFCSGDYIAYIKLFQELLNLATRLGFTLEQIDAAYRAKSDINHKRQEEGY
jgi:dimeric dUTPase (all-alpha-NTP-PPase superfamily)